MHRPPPGQKLSHHAPRPQGQLFDGEQNALVHVQQPVLQLVPEVMGIDAMGVQPVAALLAVVSFGQAVALAVGTG